MHEVAVNGGEETAKRFFEYQTIDACEGARAHRKYADALGTPNQAPGAVAVSAAIPRRGPGEFEISATIAAASLSSARSALAEASQLHIDVCSLRAVCG